MLSRIALSLVPLETVRSLPSLAIRRKGKFIADTRQRAKCPCVHMNLIAVYPRKIIDWESSKFSPAKSIKYGLLGSISARPASLALDRTGSATPPPGCIDCSFRNVGFLVQTCDPVNNETVSLSLGSDQEPRALRHQFHSICFISITRQRRASWLGPQRPLPGPPPRPPLPLQRTDRSVGRVSFSRRESPSRI